jgi:hypothetical protein
MSFARHVGQKKAFSGNLSMLSWYFADSLCGRMIE